MVIKILNEFITYTFVSPTFLTIGIRCVHLVLQPPVYILYILYTHSFSIIPCVGLAHNTVNQVVPMHQCLKYQSDIYAGKDFEQSLVLCHCRWLVSLNLPLVACPRVCL